MRRGWAPPARRVRHRAPRGRAAVAAAVVGAVAIACGPTPPDASDAAAGSSSAPPGASDQAAPSRPATEAGVPSLTIAPVVELDAPIDAVAVDRDTLWVAERGGRVVPVVDGRAGTPLLDLTGRTTTDGERGLLGLALSAERDLLVVSFTDASGDSTLEAYPVLDGRPVAAQARTLITIAQPRANHNGGAVRFGPDGMLYLALGDGGGAGDPLDAGQDRSTPLGALLRLDVSGDGPARVPSDNPFVGVAGADPRIVATGLRNPWRFSFDPATGDVWIGDVGQGRREEIDRIALADLPGTDLGWARFEGTLPFDSAATRRVPSAAPHTPPVHEYAHGPGCSVTGGVVYRGARIPALVGTYLFSDLCDGTVRGLRLGPDGRVDQLLDLGVGGAQVVGFAVDADGEVLVIDLAGRVGRLVPAAP